MIKNGQWLLTLLSWSLFVMLALLLVGHFSLLAIFGEVTHYESNLVILYTELGLSIALLGFTVGRYVSHIRIRRYR